MKAGVIGVGVMGKNHVRVYTEIKGVDEVWVYDPDEEAMKEVMEQYDAQCTASLPQLLNNVDFVSVCAPTKFHTEIAKEAIEKGVHCLVEKPLASTYVEALELCELASNSDVITGVGHIERFNPVVQEIKRLIHSPKLISIKRHNPTSSRITDVDVVVDLMIHDIDIVWNSLLKEKEYTLYSIYAEDVACVLSTFNHCIVSMSASRVACKKIRFIYVEDEGYTLEGDLMSHELYIYRYPKRYEQINAVYRQENLIEKVLIGRVEPLKEELRSFVNAINGKGEFPVSFEDGAQNIKIAEEIKNGKKFEGIHTSHGNC
jgi:predicted dehydrogenase